MTGLSPIEIARLKKDIKRIRETIFNTRLDAWGGREADTEFVRLWQLYEELRKELLTIDSAIFSRLREIPTPQPDEPQGYQHEPVFTKKHIDPLYHEIIKADEYLEVLEQSLAQEKTATDTFNVLRLLTRRFHQVSRQLRTRYSQRPTIEIEDEYDVQDLLHALLRIYFDDIRTEEWSPSYAGRCSRMDFLLKTEKIVIETKKTRKGLDAKELGDQLLIDIQRYQAHPDCKTLFCFVYDPEGRIGNASGIEMDLTKTHNGMDVVVIIEPK